MKKLKKYIVAAVAALIFTPIVGCGDDDVKPLGPSAETINAAIAGTWETQYTFSTPTDEKPDSCMRLGNFYELTKIQNLADSVQAKAGADMKSGSTASELTRTQKFWIYNGVIDIAPSSAKTTDGFIRHQQIELSQSKISGQAIQYVGQRVLYGSFVMNRVK